MFTDDDRSTLGPPHRMAWSWAGGNIDTTVSVTLAADGADATRLRLRQVGFHGLAAQLTRRILAGGYPRILGRRLPADPLPAAARLPGPAAVDGSPAATVDCAEDWRAYLGALRSWRQRG
jgi:hypothetical protein